MGQPQQDDAQMYSSDLPATLVIRQDSSGNYAIYHSSVMLAPGTQVSPDMNFTTNFDTTDPGNMMDPAAQRGIWRFFWNVFDHNARPTYRYYNSDRGFRYDYRYSPYYNYYDRGHGMHYSYYRWMR